MAVRPYNQTRRAEHTAATRQRILMAARRQLLSGRPFTMEAVSRAAGVSRVTVYTQLGDRNRLREAVFDHLADTGGLGRIPSAFTEPSQIQGIQRLVEVFCDFYATHRLLLRRLNALSALQAGSGERPAGRNRRRRHMFAVLLKGLSRQPAYQSMDVDGLAATLQALTSFEFYDQLASTRTAPPGEIVAHLVASLLQSERKD